MTWTSWAIPGLLASTLAFAATVVVLRAGPTRRLNRRLASVLFLEGAWSAAGIFFTIDDTTAFVVVASIGVGAMAALPFQYLAFLGVAARTAITRPFASRTAALLLAALSTAAATAVLVFPRVFIGELYSPPWATWNFHFTLWGSRLSLLQGGASLFGLVASLAAFLAADRGTAARERARWFATAFGVRDAIFASLYLFYPQIRPIPFWGDVLYNQLGVYGTIVFVSLLSYGVLRHQLFDLELKLKFALQRSTVGAIIAGAFFIGSEFLERFVAVDGTVLGLVSAGAIVLALRPVQAFSEAFVTRLMPGVDNTSSYLDAQKRKVYRAALEGALEDGDITTRERTILSRLAEELGLDDDAAADLEAAATPNTNRDDAPGGRA